MSYQVLARKWRPKTFSEMVGQESVLRTLTNALSQQRIHHAYLFTGTRGVGKTTLARIFAKCLNCETGITPTPCNTCSICQAIDQGRFPDLLEIDAASRTKVEDTRELLDNVHYAPTQGRFRIYLIDEVHMLSGHSFNALLKTLEEPPAHVKFLLATTDPKRLPITILSRCLQFNLKRIPDECITKQLAHICTEERITFDEKALPLISHAADGSLRDALSLLDQAIAFCHPAINLADVERMLGHVDQGSLDQLLQALADRKGDALLSTLQQLADSAPDYAALLSELMSLFHQLSVTQLVPEYKQFSLTISRFANQFSPEEVQLYYQIALMGARDLPYAPTPAEGFEMTMLRMLAFQPMTTTIEKKQTVTTSQPPTIKKPETVKMATPPVTPVTSSAWSAVLPALNLTGLAHALASNCSWVSHENNKIELALSPQHEAMLNNRLVERIQQALSNHFGKTIQLSIKVVQTELGTPAKEQQKESALKKAEATKAIQQDSAVQQLVNLFDAQVDMNSIQAVD